MSNFFPFFFLLLLTCYPNPATSYHLDLLTPWPKGPLISNLICTVGSLATSQVAEQDVLGGWIISPSRLHSGEMNYLTIHLFSVPKILTGVLSYFSSRKQKPVQRVLYTILCRVVFFVSIVTQTTTPLKNFKLHRIKMEKFPNSILSI